MAWKVAGKDLEMCEGDWGIALPITISGTTLTASDEVLFTLKNKLNGTTVLTKAFSNISQNTISLSLTESESDSLAVGTYVYSLDWYQSEMFVCNLVPTALFKVVDKA